MDKKKLIDILENPIAKQIIEETGIHCGILLADYGHKVERDPKIALEIAKTQFFELREQGIRKNSYCRIGEHMELWYSYRKELAPVPELWVDCIEDFYAVGCDIEREYYGERKGSRLLEILMNLLKSFLFFLTCQ